MKTRRSFNAKVETVMKHGDILTFSDGLTARDALAIGTYTWDDFARVSPENKLYYFVPHKGQPMQKLAKMGNTFAYFVELCLIHIEE